MSHDGPSFESFEEAERRKPSPSLMHLMTATGLLALSGLGVVRAAPSRTDCVACGKTIPPGRAGRKCAECRA
jgi:hypothetical protein